MAELHHGPGNVPGPGVPVRVERCPDVGEATFRFLGPIEGIHLHWVGKRGIPCTGSHTCPATIHRQLILWQGFAPGEIWLDNTRIWLPCVVQVSANWFEMMGADNPRGQLWKVQKVRNDWDKDQVKAELVALHNPSTLRRDVVVQPAVERVYAGREILWGQPLLLTPRQILTPSSEQPPPTASRVLPPEETEGTPEWAEKQKAFLASMKARGGLSGMFRQNGHTQEKQK